MNTTLKDRLSECLNCAHPFKHEVLMQLISDCLKHIEELESQLRERDERLQAVEKLLVESSDLLGEFAAYGNCDCDIPNGKTCEVCQAAMLQKRIKEALQPKETQ